MDLRSVAGINSGSIAGVRRDGRRQGRISKAGDLCNEDSQQQIDCIGLVLMFLSTPPTV